MLRDAWDRHAKEWIAWARAPGHDTYWQFHRDRFLDLVPEPGRLTLDLGCGEGRVARDLARLGHRVVALDASPMMAAAAASHLEMPGPVLVADVAALPVATGAADCAVSFMVLQDVDDPEGALAEAGRVLAPGGRLVAALVHPLNSAGFFESPTGGGHPRFVIERSWFEPVRTSERIERGGYEMTFHAEHRPLERYVAALRRGGFVIEDLREVADPDPSDRWHAIPLFLHLVARRVAPT